MYIRESNKFWNNKESMQLAASYLSRSERNEGLNPHEVEFALKVIKHWKQNLVSFLVGKADLAHESSVKDTRSALIEYMRKHGSFISERSRNVFSYQLKKMETRTLTRKTASELVDRLFVRFYEGEVRARDEHFTTYGCREASTVEFMENSMETEYQRDEDVGYGLADQPMPFYVDTKKQDVDNKRYEFTREEQNEKFFELKAAVLATHKKSIVLRRAFACWKLGSLHFRHYRLLQRLAGVNV